VNNDNLSEKTQNGFHLRSVAFWLAFTTAVLLVVTVVTMLRVSSKFGSLIDATNTYVDKEMAQLDVTQMSGFIQGQQYNLEKVQSLFIQQQIYTFVLVALLVITFLVIALLVLRPISRFEKALDNDEELPLIGSVEIKELAESYNCSKRNSAASSLVFKHEAEHDALTGLFNRGAFEKMKQYLSGSLDPLAILILDVDLFKHVNDGYGHEVGDMALKKVSATLTECFRSSDLVFRIGGDEFCVIMQMITPGEKDVIRDKIDAINLYLGKADDRLPIKLSVSVGIAFSQFGFNEELFKKCDKALYYTKEHGRKGYTFYNSSIEKENNYVRDIPSVAHA
jgi:diguanylate cyclase (GGDEF)-like protein